MRKGRWWLVGVANKINELAPVEGNLPSSLVMVLLCCTPGSVCLLLTSYVNSKLKSWRFFQQYLKVQNFPCRFFFFVGWVIISFFGILLIKRKVIKMLIFIFPKTHTQFGVQSICLCGRISILAPLGNIYIVIAFLNANQRLPRFLFRIRLIQHFQSWYGDVEFQNNLALSTALKLLFD